VDEILIYGTGAHARKAYHCALSMGVQVHGFVDQNRNAKTPVPEKPVIHAADLGPPLNDIRGIFVAIGRPEVRSKLMDQLVEAGWHIATLIHARATLSPDSTVEAGTLVAAGAVIESGAVIGRGAIVDIGVLIDHDSEVGPFVHLRAGEVLGPRSKIASPLVTA
jgi:UDP-3-O-[3-hydroxymyristoyl] glucosamine N-acyltransferase